MGDRLTKRDTAIMLATFMCFASTTPLFAPNTSIFRGMGTPAMMDWFIFPMFLSALLTSIALTLAARSRARDEEPAAKALPLASLVYALSCVAFALLASAGLENNVISCATGIACGASFVLLLSRWAILLSSMEYRPALLFSLLACIGTALITTALTWLPGLLKVVCFSALAAVGAIAPLFLQCVRRDNAEGPSGSTGDLIRTLRVPAAGLLLYAFVMSISKFQVFNLLDGELAGGMAAALCIAPLFFFRKSESLSSIVYHVIAPAIGGVVIVLLAFPEDSVARSIAIPLMYVFLSALAILALATIIAIMHAGEFSAPFVTGLAMVLGCAVSLAGLCVMKGTGGENLTSVVLVLVAAYCAFLLVMLGLSTWRLISESSEERVPESASAAGNAAEQLGDPFAWVPDGSCLSEREKEILAYLGRGHTVVFIAEKLFISESTVRTHIKHIYAKLGVHSREELFALMDRQSV